MCQRGGDMNSAVLNDVVFDFQRGDDLERAGADRIGRDQKRIYSRSLIRLSASSDFPILRLRRRTVR
jgi:hypothetical protein